VGRHGRGQQAVEFFVREQGRYIYGLRAPGPYPLRCTDGSVTSAEAYIEAAWIGADGNVKLPPSPGDAPPAGVTLDAKIGGVSRSGQPQALRTARREPRLLWLQLRLRADLLSGRLERPTITEYPP
jgi:hypothetical protein